MEPEDAFFHATFARRGTRPLVRTREQRESQRARAETTGRRDRNSIDLAGDLQELVVRRHPAVDRHVPFDVELELDHVAIERSRAGRCDRGRPE